MEHLTSQKASDQSQHKLQMQQYEDEIDLKELLVSLWEGKFIIALVSLTFFLVAVAYSLLAAEKWEAKAVIAQPELNQFKEFEFQVSQYQLYVNDKRLDDLIVPELMLISFVQQFNNRENKKQYLESNPEFQRRFSALEKTDNEELEKINEQKLYHAWYQRLTIQKVAKAKNDKSADMYELMAQASNAQSSYELLLGYLAFINNKSQEAIQKNFISVVNGKRNQLKQKVDILIEQAKSQLLVERLKSKYELDIAQSAGVSRPLENYEVQSESVFSIALGADALKTKVKVLEGLDNLSLIEPMIAQSQVKLSLLNNLKISPNVEFQVMQFVEKPEKPSELSAPHRKVIAILGAILGAGLGVAVVLAGVAFRKRDKAKA